ncbi:MAG: flagellar protein export ATPase FliI [Proteobacteria bacterium]|nr:flagellar protein export ATPase FliI [Pseudomonadota bacterium]
MAVLVHNILSEIDRLQDRRVFGEVTAVVGMLIEVGGARERLTIGDRVRLLPPGREPLLCEVVGFRNDRALVMPFGELAGVGLGCRAEVGSAQPVIYPDEGWLGRVVDALARPADGKGPLPEGKTGYLIRNRPPVAHRRERIRGKVDLGLRAMNAFLTTCRGQRMGIFSGSGVGKSTLLSMMARHTACDVSVIGLIGERGREAREFVEDDLGPEGLKRSVLVLATADESPLMRRQAAYVMLSVCEYFRDLGLNVLCLMDSITRFAMAQREIGLSTGEPPTSKGYPPSVFAELPRLLERAGPGEGKGSITGLFSVLVEGDDYNEPITDAVRGILDGHVVLSRAIAERGRYPAVDVLRSVSRAMPDCNTPDENKLVSRARRIVATYEDMAELIRLGAYRRGSDAAVDEAIKYYDRIDAFLAQDKAARATLDQGYAMLAEIFAK